MASPARVVFVGVDACDVDLVRSLATAGKLPTFGRLLRTSAVVETQAPVGVFVGSVWPTVFTGLSPATFDYYCWAELDRETYEISEVSPDRIHATPLWHHASAAGRRVAVFDVPHARVEELDGAMVGEWGCHDRRFGTASWPRDLLGEIDDVAGRHPVGTVDFTTDSFSPCDHYPCRGDERSLDDSRTLWKALCEGEAAKRAASLHLLGKGDWDLFMTVLGEAHCTGHQFWHAHDRTHPRFDADLRIAIGDPLAAMYARLDRTVGAHLEAAGDEATVFVLLSHGMQAHHDGDHLLDQVLHRFALVDGGYEPGWRSRTAARAFEWLPDGARARARGLASGAVRRRIHRAPPPPNPDLPPRETRPWFQVPNNSATGGVRFNVIGREPSGVIEPGAELEAATARLTEWLHEIVNVDTGAPAVIEVLRTDDFYDRKPDSVWPDLFVEWDRRAPIERIWSPRIGTIFGPYVHWRTGDHHRRGLLLARGPGIRPGRREGYADLTDVAATLSAAARFEVPDAAGIVRPDLIGERV